MPEMIHKVLASEVRQKILLLLKEKEKYLSQIAEEMKMAPQTVDFHLQMMVELGVVGTELREGKKYYFLKDRKILEHLKSGRPLPPEHLHKPPHELVLEAWEDIGKRLDKIEKRLEAIEKKI
ncbi:MAG: winged helix-turn-helix transcriptional regulator [Candidatus Aenigmarchaeota archaeon]|nr:winged helix-turn-helix transcriptional regulator [Candidatus Aenigmarchaeota archaeon]